MLLPLTEWGHVVRRRAANGSRLAGLYGSEEDGACQLTALLVEADRVDAVSTLVTADRDGVMSYPSLSPEIPAAFWYERALHDLSGVVPTGHPRLDPLLLVRSRESPAPRPGAPLGAAELMPIVTERRGPVDVGGHGMFTLPLGPVRSGVMESIEFLIETPGEDIPHLNIRPHYKHRGIAKQFEGRRLIDGVLIAERVEGISSVAHALAFCHAVESLGEVEVDHDAALLRVVHAELERMANHLDVTMRLADTAGLAVAAARFGWHKERVLRLVSMLCGSRFGRGVLAVGGLAQRTEVDGPAVSDEVVGLRHQIESDLAALQSSASFLDRLRNTGPLASQVAAEYGALGPIGRGSGVDNDVRRDRPYDGYLDLAGVPRARSEEGDALARSRVRWRELTTSADLIVEALEQLGRTTVEAAPRDVLEDVPDGLGIGSAESAQGEVMHAIEVRDGLIKRGFARSASLHNLVLLHDVFAGDIFTDFPFIEASFGLGYAGVAM